MPRLRPPESARFGPLDDIRALPPIGHGLRERADWGQGGDYDTLYPSRRRVSHAGQRCPAGIT